MHRQFFKYMVRHTNGNMHTTIEKELNKEPKWDKQYHLQIVASTHLQCTPIDLHTSWKE